MSLLCLNGANYMSSKSYRVRNLTNYKLDLRWLSYDEKKDCTNYGLRLLPCHAQHYNRVIKID